ncbi:MAG: CBS domain-containing protein [Pseudomonadota bacterium]
MPNNFQNLPIDVLPVATKLRVPVQNTKDITLHDSAISVMTDLKCICAITIAAGEGIHFAEYKMKNQQVRMLFVVDHNEFVIGVLTYRDVSGLQISKSEKELNIPTSEMCILDIMIGIDAIDVLDYETIKTAKVGDIVETLKKLNRQHIIVLEKEQGMQQIRGIFSSTQIGRQLKTELNIPFQTIENKLNNEYRMA